MGWQPKPSDIRGTWLGKWEFCIMAITSGMMDGPELVLVNRLIGDTQWSSVGASDGSVYMSSGTFEADVFSAGGFRAWREGVVAKINDRLFVECRALDANAPGLSLAVDKDAPPPTTWPEFTAWLSHAARWENGSAPSPGPQPIPAALFPLYGARAFFAGLGFDCGIEADGRPACRVNIPSVGWKKFTLE